MVAEDSEIPVVSAILASPNPARVQYRLYGQVPIPLCTSVCKMLQVSP